MKRNRSIDIIKGILIVIVVAAHYKQGSLHDFIFLFHMPVFFIVSGMLLNRNQVTSPSYVVRKLNSLMTPYITYLLWDFLIVRRDFSTKTTMRMLYGVRALTGVYWYITCFLFAIFILSYLLKKKPDKTVKVLILAGGIAVIESYLVDHIPLLQSPGIPWNLDVSLMALVYIGIGFFHKEKIKKLIELDSVKYDMAALLTANGISRFLLDQL